MQPFPNESKEHFKMRLNSTYPATSTDFNAFYEKEDKHILKDVQLFSHEESAKRGRIYDKASVKKAFEAYRDSNDAYGFISTGEPTLPLESRSPSRMDISHKVRVTSIEEDQVRGDIVVVGVGRGYALKDLIRDDPSPVFGLRGLIEIKDGKEVELLKVISVDYIPQELRKTKQEE